MESNKNEVTRLLEAWSGGDEQALDQLIPLVENELRSIAKRFMAKERPNHTLQPTALINELYLRLLEPDQVSWENRAHFLGFAAQTMRRILVDHARRRMRKRRNEGVKPLPLDEMWDQPTAQDQELVHLDDALDRLKRLEAKHSQAVELFYFTGLSYKEIAVVQRCSEATAKRNLTAGRAWIRRTLRPREPEKPIVEGGS